MWGSFWSLGQKGRIHVEFFLSMEEKHKGEEKGVMTYRAASKEREECCDRRRKVKKKKKRRHGTRKLCQISKSRLKDKARDEMTWKNICRSKRANKITAENDSKA